MAHGDMAEGIDHVFTGEDAVGGDQIVDGFGKGAHG